jgi:TPR repeat protein
LKKAKFHLEPAAMAGHEVARYMLGFMDFEEGKKERAVKHWIISASAGNQHAMHQLRKFFEKGVVNRNTIDSTLKAYNNSCAEMRSEARDTCVRLEMRRINA